MRSSVGPFHGARSNRGRAADAARSTSPADGGRLRSSFQQLCPEEEAMAEATTDEERTADGQPTLKRVMGPGLLLLFIVGDILGTGIYALTGQVAAEVGGVVWLPFLVAFLVALVTAFSYLELVTKYPQAAGAALYTHKAFGIHFVTFLVALDRKS